MTRLDNIKRVLVIAHDNEGSWILFKKIISAYPDLHYMVAITTGLYYKKSFIGSIIKLLREASWIFVFVRFIELVIFKLKFQGIKRLCKARQIPVVVTSDVNSKEFFKLAKSFAPDVMVSLYTMQLYKTPIINMAPFGAIQVHPSLLPAYRGLEVFFWVLANKEKETGSSVFYLTEKIDGGRIIGQDAMVIEPNYSVSDLYKLTSELGGDLLVKVIKNIDAGNIKYIKNGRTSKYYKMPDRDAYLRFKKSGRRFF